MIHQFHKYELITVLFMLKLVPESETILTTIVHCYKFVLGESGRSTAAKEGKYVDG